ncbi:hypothetical protein BDQ12DRAFT_759536 [Crucibulum laeve]|uniref:Uncharacterized protein n=1 Tax=Crucibulum laeve TaxID=68775 RepID=A0A5C3LEG7_9AGAR|nr:hypothetical protein BDQ12DRAFT_759536 [Crucibulum laeve]
MTSPATITNVCNGTGPLLVGCCISTVFWICTSIFITRPSQLKIGLQAYDVWKIYCETVHSVLVAQDTFVTFAFGFDDPYAVIRIDFAWLSGLVLWCIAHQNPVKIDNYSSGYNSDE